MEKESINGMMGVIIVEIGKKIALVDLENMYGRMEEVIKGIGGMEKCMGKVFIFGKMGEGMKVNIKTTKNMVKENTIGLMAKNLKEHGLMAKEKEEGLLPIQKDK